MLSTDKPAPNILADILVGNGVSHAVLSPGTRNAPIIAALNRRKELTCLTVVDERVAAFMALGIALQSGKPVVLVCTSGSAVTNYGPALSEAFYRRVPLIVVSADRPECWIGQDDSQTIRQPGALSSVVKKTVNIPAAIENNSDLLWMTNRLINEAILTALTGPRGPVHINIQLDAPLNNHSVEYAEGSARVIKRLIPRFDLPTSVARSLGLEIASPRRVMIIVGFHAPDSKLNRALGRLARLPNFVVVAENTANLHSPDFFTQIDAVLPMLSDQLREELRPDTVITAGGSLVSAALKAWMRRLNPVEHWHVGIDDGVIDCFRRLSLKIEMEPATFFGQLASAMQPHRNPCTYAETWRDTTRRCLQLRDEFVAQSPWCGLTAFSHIIPAIPEKWNLHVSNGMSIRYSQLFNCRHIHRLDCNRGVSGIDGSTSTAIGAAIAYPSAPTLLITGDMSAHYDVGALFSPSVPGNFKMIVMANNGGDIFRFIKPTSGYPEVEQRIAAPEPMPWEAIASALGWNYLYADSMQSLGEAMNRLINESDRPALMVVDTSEAPNAQILRNYFSKKLPS